MNPVLIAGVVAAIWWFLRGSKGNPNATEYVVPNASSSGSTPVTSGAAGGQATSPANPTANNQAFAAPGNASAVYAKPNRAQTRQAYNAPPRANLSPQPPKVGLVSNIPAPGSGGSGGCGCGGHSAPGCRKPNPNTQFTDGAGGCMNASRNQQIRRSVQCGGGAAPQNGSTPPGSFTPLNPGNNAIAGNLTNWFELTGVASSAAALSADEASILTTESNQILTGLVQPEVADSTAVGNLLQAQYAWNQANAPQYGGNF